MIVKKLLTLALLSLLVACDWVDSTGRGSGSTPVTQINFANGQSTDATALVEEGLVIVSVIASGIDGEVDRYQWRPDPVAQGNLDQCAGVSDFDSNIAAETLALACTATEDCTVTFEQLQTEDQNVDFRVVAPQLRAPVGVTYQLDAVDNNGGTGSLLSTFCLIAMNEAPDAQDDFFNVLEGQILTVPNDLDPKHLLTNDEKHDYVTNEALTVVPEQSTEPSLSSSFSLFGDGGFIYESSLIADRTADRAIDTFDYVVTDGVETASATVTVNVIARNDPPVLAGPIPPQQVTAGVPFESDLSAFFTDQDDPMLSFAISAGSLPESGGLTLSPNGMLSGTAELVDEGSYNIQIVATDGIGQTSADVGIVVVTNFPVEAQPIADQFSELGEELEIDLSNFFTDPEGDPLTYRVNSQFTTADIEVDADTGELTATFNSVGRFTIDISASDGINTPANNRFSVTVSNDNVAPVFRVTIRNVSISEGVRMTPINIGASFFDANADALRYTIVGVLPDGLTLSATGLLSGIPAEEGTFTPIRIVATDPFEESAISNAFQIRVLPAF